METPEVVVEQSSKEAIETQVAEPVEKTEEQPVEESITVPEAKETEPKQEKQQEGESSVIKQMRRQLRQQQKMIAELRQATIQPEPQPVREQFASEDEFIDAKIDYKLKQQAQPQPQQPSIYNAKIEEAKKTYSDFEDAFEDISHVNFVHDKALHALVANVEALQYGSDVLYHLAKNPETMEELAVLPEHLVAARIGEIHADIRRAKTTKQVSKAPAPITPVNAITKTEKTYDDMSQEEFMARRRKEREAYRRSKFGL